MLLRVCWARDQGLGIHMEAVGKPQEQMCLLVSMCWRSRSGSSHRNQQRRQKRRVHGEEQTQNAHPHVDRAPGRCSEEEVRSMPGMLRRDD